MKADQAIRQAERVRAAFKGRGVAGRDRHLGGVFFKVFYCGISDPNLMLARQFLSIGILVSGAFSPPECTVKLGCSAVIFRSNSKYSNP
ncbi:hypothetical protein [Methylobacterium tarhaniae]|uniref:hypothetical protein n=1 Tax=Methylobacterium tarhaniae TaxID=1187852 RepID=UPI000A771E25|nr:hypothetical protein [Methylobacterium tarhaniae]